MQRCAKAELPIRAQADMPRCATPELRDRARAGVPRGAQAAVRQCAAPAVRECAKGSKNIFKLTKKFITLLTPSLHYHFASTVVGGQ